MYSVQLMCYNSLATQALVTGEKIDQELYCATLYCEAKINPNNDTNVDQNKQGIEFAFNCFEISGKLTIFYDKNSLETGDVNHLSSLLGQDPEAIATYRVNSRNVYEILARVIARRLVLHRRGCYLLLYDIMTLCYYVTM